MSESARRDLIELAENENLLLLEDNPYGILAEPEARIPTLKSMDRGDRIGYFGTFAKAVFAGVRVGYVLADQRTGHDGLLADELSKSRACSR